MFFFSEIISTEADAYKKYYDFYFNYYSKKYTTSEENKPSESTNTSFTESTVPSLPSAMSQLASKLSSIVSQEQRNQFVDNTSPKSNIVRAEKPPVVDKFQNLNEKNAENARQIADEIRESVKEESAKQVSLTTTMTNGGLPGLGCYSDSDSE